MTDSEGRFTLEGTSGRAAIPLPPRATGFSLAQRPSRCGAIGRLLLFLREKDSTATPSLEVEATNFSPRTHSDIAAVDSAFVRVGYRTRNPTSDARVSSYEVCLRIPTEGNTFYHEEEGDSFATGQVDVGRFERYTSDEQAPDACRRTASSRRGLKNAAEEGPRSEQCVAGHGRLMLR